MKAALVLLALSGFVASSQAFSACKPCLAVVGFIETEVTRDESQEDKILDAACAKEAPGPLTKVCDLIVNAALKFVVNEIDTKQPPAKVCAECHLCTSAELAEVEAEEATLVEQLKAGPGLNKFCGQLAKIEKTLADNAATVEQKAAAVCADLAKVLPGFECKDVDAEAKKIVADAEALLKRVGKFCPKHQEEEAAVEAEIEELKGGPGFNKFCGQLDKLEKILANPAPIEKKVAAVCAQVEKIVPHFSCKDLDGQADKVIEFAEGLVKKVAKYCPKHQVAEVQGGIPYINQICPLLQTAETALSNPKQLKDLFNEFCPALQTALGIKINCQKLYKYVLSNSKEVQMVLEAVIGEICPSSVELMGGLPDIQQLCPIIQAVNKIVNNRATVNKGVTAFCGFLADQGVMSNGQCVALVKKVLPEAQEVIGMLAGMCPSSAAVEVQAVQEVQGGNPLGQLCAFLPTLEKIVANPKIAIQYVDQICDKVQPFVPKSKFNCKQEVVAFVTDLQPELKTLVVYFKALCPSATNFAVDASITPCQGAELLLKETEKAVAALHLSGKAEAAAAAYIQLLTKAEKVACAKHEEEEEAVVVPDELKFGPGFQKFCGQIAKAEKILNNNAATVEQKAAQICAQVHDLLPQVDCSAANKNLKSIVAKVEAIVNGIGKLCKKADEPEVETVEALQGGNPIVQLCGYEKALEKLVNDPSTIKQDIGELCPYLAALLPNFNCDQAEASVIANLPKIKAILKVADLICAKAGDAIVEASITPCQGATLLLQKTLKAVAALPPKAQAVFKKYVIPELVKAKDAVCQKPAALEEVQAGNPFAKICAQVKQIEHDLADPSAEKAALAKACKVVKTFKPGFDCTALENKVMSAVAQAEAILKNVDAVCAKL